MNHKTVKKLLTIEIVNGIVLLEISEHVTGVVIVRSMIMCGDETFGGFVRKKRLEANVNLRKLAEILGIAPAYMSDIENNHRYPPEKDKIYKIAETLNLTKEETDYLFDLAADNKKNLVSPDIADYIMGQELSRVALRIARDTGAGEKEWEKVIEMLEKERAKKK